MGKGPAHGQDHGLSTLLTMDIETNHRGDFLVSPDGDLAVATHRQAKFQAMLFRLQTTIDDFIPDPRGPWADLQQFIGEKSSRESGESMQRQAERAIFHEFLVAPQNTRLDVVPVGANEVVLTVRVENEWPSNEGSPIALGLLYEYFTGEVSVISGE